MDNREVGWARTEPKAASGFCLWYAGVSITGRAGVTDGNVGGSRDRANRAQASSRGQMIATMHVPKPGLRNIALHPALGNVG